MRRAAAVLFFAASLALAHPMGNFSVNHYARLQTGSHGIELVYALDLAELPTFDLLRSWKLERNSPRPLLDARAREQAQEWLKGLQIHEGGRMLRPKLEGVELTIADGAGNLPILRITARAHLDAAGGSVSYEDTNFADRAGWKEIVIAQGAGALIEKASQPDRELSKALTEYPPDPTVAPPQDLRAQLTWAMEQPVVAQRTPAPPKPVHAAPVIAPIPQPRSTTAAPPPAAMTPAAAPAGSVVRGDFLSRLLHQSEITPWMMVIGIAMAFVLGAAHALTPGHGKTIVAAYLVGSRGTLKHAAFLGAMVTFTHTISVFALGLATLFLFRYVMPDKIAQVLGVISGLSIVAIGIWMAYKRLRGTRAAAHHHHHHHDHAHEHGHHHCHAHDAAHHHHDHDHHDHHHSHGPGGHSHVPDELSWAGLMALGASGGLVPCESALVLLLGAIALGRVGLGLLLLVAFSAGLAIVLMAVGAIVLYAKKLLPDRKRSHPLFRWMPVASAVIVTLIGVVMTGISLGWIRPSWMLS